VEHFADRLMAAIAAKKTPACVGFDPLVDRLPPQLRIPAGADLAAKADAILAFGRGVIAAVADYVPALKINVAFFEPYHEPGLRAYTTLIREARAAGLIVIGDVKRADIGHTSGQYAAAYLAPSPDDPPGAALADAITINPYFGSEGVAPFIDAAREHGRGVFVLVQTSNESAVEVQGLQVSGGLTVCQEVGRLVERWATGNASPQARRSDVSVGDSSPTGASAAGLVGACGYSCVGAVVSPRDLESTVHIRELMPHCIFLVPGFGAQGRTADEVAKCFKPDGTGALVTASRSVILAHENARHRAAGSAWQDAVRAACRDFVASLRAVASER